MLKKCKKYFWWINSGFFFALPLSVLPQCLNDGAEYYDQEYQAEINPLVPSELSTCGIFGTFKNRTDLFL